MNSSFSFIRLVICLVLVGSYFFLPKYGFTFIFSQPAEANSSFFTLHSSLLPHFLYPLSHANIWHLAANILCLFLLRCPTHIFITYAIAVLCSFLPCPSWSMVDGQWSIGYFPTMGFSGILFAMVGLSWGKVHRFRDMLWKNKWFLIVPFFIPHVNAFIHIYCLITAYTFSAKLLPAKFLR